MGYRAASETIWQSAFSVLAERREERVNIGEEREIIYIEPIEEPIFEPIPGEVPVEAPEQPVEKPVPVPA